MQAMGGFWRILGLIASTYARLLAESPPVIGLDAIFDGRRSSRIRKLAWTLGIMPLCYLTVVQLQAVLQDYFNYEVTVSFESTLNESFRFPAVTVCNSNPLRRSHFCSKENPITNASGLTDNICIADVVRFFSMPF